MYTEYGEKYLVFCGVDALNWDHNDDEIKKEIINCNENDGIMHVLDMHTEVKSKFFSALPRKY